MILFLNLQLNQIKIGRNTKNIFFWSFIRSVNLKYFSIFKNIKLFTLPPLVLVIIKQVLNIKLNKFSIVTF